MLNHAHFSAGQTIGFNRHSASQRNDDQILQNTPSATSSACTMRPFFQNRPLAVIEIVAESLFSASKDAVIPPKFVNTKYGKCIALNVDLPFGSYLIINGHRYSGKIGEIHLPLPDEDQEEVSYEIEAYRTMTEGYYRLGPIRPKGWEFDVSVEKRVTTYIIINEKTRPDIGLQKLSFR